MAKFFVISIISFSIFLSTSLISEAGLRFEQKSIETDNVILEVADGRLSVGMTKKEAFDIEGVPYRVKRLQGEEGKEMWIYRCNNDDGFDEDCLYLYFSGDELRKIEEP